VVTRPKNHGGTLVRKLEELGAIPMLLPVTEIAEPLNLAVLDSALKKLGEFDWMVFTSPNGVESVARRFAALGLSFAQFPGLKIAVVGPATAEALAALGRVPDAMPSKFISDEIANAIPDPMRKRILLARGDLARAELPTALSRQGAVVVDLTVYRIVRSDVLPEFDTNSMPDAITVMSGESARATIEQLRDCGLEEWLEKVPIACIGPVTAATVKQQRIEPAAVAEEHTVDGLLRSLEDLFLRNANTVAARHPLA
jgi:uroporphyrinogen-III synthase